MITKSDLAECQKLVDEMDDLSAWRNVNRSNLQRPANQCWTGLPETARSEKLIGCFLAGSNPAALANLGRLSAISTRTVEAEGDPQSRGTPGQTIGNGPEALNRDHDSRRDGENLGAGAATHEARHPEPDVPNFYGRALGQHRSTPVAAATGGPAPATGVSGPKKARCWKCQEWEPIINTGCGWCPIFEKETRASHGSQCTAFVPLSTPAAPASQADQSATAGGASTPAPTAGVSNPNAGVVQAFPHGRW